MAMGKTRTAGMRGTHAPGHLTNRCLSAILIYSWFYCKGWAEMPGPLLFVFDLSKETIQFVKGYVYRSIKNLVFVA